MEYKPIEKNDVGYISRVAGTLKKAALTGLAGLVLMAGGCMSDTGIAIDFLKIKAGNQSAIGTPETAVASTSEDIFRKDTEPYDKSEISNGLATSPVWNHYKNREQ